MVNNEPKDRIQDYVDALCAALPAFKPFSHHDIKRVFKEWGCTWKAKHSLPKIFPEQSPESSKVRIEFAIIIIIILI